MDLSDRCPWQFGYWNGPFGDWNCPFQFSFVWICDTCLELLVGCLDSSASCRKLSTRCLGMSVRCLALSVGCVVLSDTGLAFSNMHYRLPKPIFFWVLRVFWFECGLEVLGFQLGLLLQAACGWSYPKFKIVRDIWEVQTGLFFGSRTKLTQVDSLAHSSSFTQQVGFIDHARWFFDP